MLWMKPLLHALTDAEPWLNFVVLLVLLRAKVWKRFPMMTFYLAFRCFADAALYFVLEEHHFIAVSERTQTLTYIYGYWTCYLIAAIAVFLALQELFTAVMEPVPGLQRLGLTIFRWVSFATVIIVTGMSISPILAAPSNGYYLVSVIGLQMMRCISILEICLLAYLAISVHSLGRSFRGRVFGLGLGLGLEAAGELICAALSSRPGSIWSMGNLILEISATATLAIWATYFLLPETAEDRAPITLPVTSPLLRWNAIASALGQRPAHVALGPTSSSFFLQDVERVVDKIMVKSK